MTKLINPKSLYVSIIWILLKINKKKLYFIKRISFNIFSLHQKQFKKKLKEFAKQQNQHHNNLTQIKHWNQIMLEHQPFHIQHINVLKNIALHYKHNDFESSTPHGLYLQSLKVYFSSMKSLMKVGLCCCLSLFLFISKPTKAKPKPKLWNPAGLDFLHLT
jgi:hypothetical protein